MESGFQINEAFYPIPQAFRMGDPVLVEEVTGLSWGDFSDRLDEPEGDPVVMLGMLAVAVWQTNPRWRRDRVARWVEAIDIEAVKFIDGEETDAGPPPVTEAAPTSNGSAEPSSVPPDSNSDTTPPSTTPVGSPPTIPVSA